MPTYDYECSKCGHRFEVFQKMSDEPIMKCPKCRSKSHRLIGAGSGIIFKGSGFYQTDYKNKGSGQDTTCRKSDPSSEGCKSCPMSKSKKRKG